jgi:hypothetical protein
MFQLSLIHSIAVIVCDPLTIRRFALCILIQTMVNNFPPSIVLTFLKSGPSKLDIKLTCTAQSTRSSLHLFQMLLEAFSAFVFLKSCHSHDIRRPREASHGGSGKLMTLRKNATNASWCHNPRSMHKDDQN